jgi:hypothetical protein
VLSGVPASKRASAWSYGADSFAHNSLACRGGFPANKVTVVANEFGPQTADLVAG